MSWTEITPGHYERPLDSMEKFHMTVGLAGAAVNREHWAISAVARFRLDLSPTETEAALKDAWKTMRFHQPKIATYRVDDKIVYKVPNAAALDSWVAETFIVSPPDVSASNLFSTYRPTTLATLHYLPHTSEILLHSSHWRTDGIGAVMFLGRFFEVLANPTPVEFGSEGKNLSPSLEAACKLSTAVNPETEQAATAQLMEFLANVPAIGLPTLPEQVPGASGRCELELDAGLTSRIISQAKAKGFTVTTAAHAAVVGATQKLTDPSTPSNKYTSWSIFDLRKYCPAPFNGADHAVSVYHVGLPHTLVPSDFTSNATQLKKIYARQFTGSASNTLSFLDCYVQKVIALFGAPPPPEAIPATEGSLSSLGLIDGYLKDSYGNGKVVIENFWLAVEQLTRQPQLHIWTYNGKMKLSACYNSSFFSQDFMEQLLGTMKSILVKELEA